MEQNMRPLDDPFPELSSAPQEQATQKSPEGDSADGVLSGGSVLQGQNAVKVEGKAGEQGESALENSALQQNSASQQPFASDNLSAATPIMECRHLEKLYGKTVALTDVSFCVQPGGVVGLLGPNGSGKSTLIKLAMGMLQPSGGEIFLDGKKPSHETKAFTAYLPDANYLCDWMKVDQQVRYCADFFEDFNPLKAEGMLSRLGISGKQKIKTLSKGNKEKLGLILTMARDARLYILDEPIAGVDPAARDFILDTVMTNRPKGATIFLCTHLISDIEPILTHALFLNRGSIVLDSSVQEVKEREGKTLDELFREVFRW